MNCKRFEIWLLVRDQAREADATEAMAHAADCVRCREMLRLDDAAESALKSGLGRVEAPASLRASVRLAADRGGTGKARRRWPLLALPASGLTALALLLIVIFQPFGSSLSSIEQIARLAEQSHFAGYTMQFRAGEVSDLAGWFRDKLDFEVAPPDLAHRGLEFLGGRKCALGGKDVAYLFFEQDGKRYSLFQLDAGDVKVELKEGQTYRYPIHDCVVELWKERNRVYVLIV
jgi:anti-sigma factor RsiW